MAKKKKTTTGKQKPKQDLTALPQNIVMVGDQVDANKRIYISQETYQSIQSFTFGKTKNESGGVLVGNVIEAFGKTNIMIRGFIEAKHTEATPSTLTFTHDTWNDIHAVMEKKYPNLKMVGWIHTHPGFGVFLSEYDKFIHESVFNEAYQVAYVVDPVQETEGFFFWLSGELERCKGFYLFDQPGVKITVAEEAQEEGEAEPQEGEKAPLPLQRILLCGMAVVILLLLLCNGVLFRKIRNLEENQDKLLEHDHLYYELYQTLTGGAFGTPAEDATGTPAEDVTGTPVEDVTGTPVEDATTLDADDATVSAGTGE